MLSHCRGEQSSGDWSAPMADFLTEVGGDRSNPRYMPISRPLQTRISGWIDAHELYTHKDRELYFVEAATEPLKDSLLRRNHEALNSVVH